MKAESRVVNLVLSIMSLAISYGFASLAIDRGNFWWYLFSLVFFIFALKYLVKVIKRNYGNHKAV